MPDIYLYLGETNPNDITVSDPTVLRGGVVNVTGTGTVYESGSVIVCSAQEEFVAGSVLSEAGESIVSSSALIFQSTASLYECGETASSSGALNFVGASNISECGEIEIVSGTLEFTSNALLQECGEKSDSSGKQTFDANSFLNESGESLSISCNLIFNGITVIYESGESASSSSEQIFESFALISEQSDAIGSPGMPLAIIVESTFSIQGLGEITNDEITIDGTVSLEESGDFAESSGESTNIIPAFMWGGAGGGKLGDIKKYKSNATGIDGAESVSACGVVFMPESKGDTKIEDILNEDEEILTLFAMIEGD